MQTNELSGTITDVGRVRTGLASLLFAAIAVLMVADMASDAGTGANRLHLMGEALVMVAAFAGVGLLWRGWRAAEARAAQLDVDLDAARREADRFRTEARDALQGLGVAIDAQFERWKLTPAEREIGLLLLKGLSHREVAEIRQTTEVTVRQQSLTLYRKAGLRSRSDLSAFFLEDLLLPRDQTATQA
ncbi:MAG: LuxR family transcriptional regulator [Acidobacteria bacterium]|nr:LuxR family transcriptional regulator [Acidobacteriota bacterium]